MKVPRVAFFTDSFHEVNGVALTSREFDGFAQRRGYPFCSVHAGPRTLERTEGEHLTIELSHSPLSLGLEHDLRFDLMFWRYQRWLGERVRAFQPDLVHITGPGQFGILGAMIAHELRVPLVASWHTNVHEFGSRRLEKLLGWWPAGMRAPVVRFTERQSLRLILRFYKLARLHFAPNPELVQFLAERTGNPTHLMERGIDTELFAPARRRRTDTDFVIGYVGRLSPEKNVRLLARLERSLLDAGVKSARFLIVGDGSERSWLSANMKRADLPGILKGEPLAEAYANMDVFVFPSETDTFGNVVLEAMASGVPAVVSAFGGPKFLVRDGTTGYIAGNELDFVNSVLLLYRHHELRSSMRDNSRRLACQRSWDAVFGGTYDRYTEAMANRRFFASGTKAGTQVACATVADA
ncbi:MAG TPA: glycosyltransferase [Bryobacteraceae bacterium]|nr:glycosyltransferase [Bryobacteraceae bacterium]